MAETTYVSYYINTIYLAAGLCVWGGGGGGYNLVFFVWVLLNFHVHRDHFVHDGSHYVYHPTPALSSSRSPLLQTPTTSTAAASTKEVPTGCETISLTRYQDSNKYALLNVEDKDITGTY